MSWGLYSAESTGGSFGWRNQFSHSDHYVPSGALEHFIYVVILIILNGNTLT